MGIATLTELTTQVRRRADMEGSQFVSDSEVQQYIQDSWGEYWDLLIECAPAEHFAVQTYPITLTSSSNNQAQLNELDDVTPAAVHKILRVLLIDGSNQYQLMPSQAAFVAGSSTNRGRPTHYMVTGPGYTRLAATNDSEVRQLLVSPQPDGNYTIRVWYIPSPPDLTTDNKKNLYDFAGWREYIICDAAAKCLEKEESFAAAALLMQRKMVVEQRIRYHLATMDASSGGMVRDLDAEEANDNRRYWRGEPW